MKNYKLKLTNEQLKYLQSTINAMFQSHIDNLDHVQFYNLKSIMKRLNDKLFNLSYRIINATDTFTISIDVNEYQALKALYSLCEEAITQNMYLNALYTDVFQQIDKQEFELMNRHNVKPPTKLMLHKMISDNFNRKSNE